MKKRKRMTKVMKQISPYSSLFDMYEWIISDWFGSARPCVCIWLSEKAISMYKETIFIPIIFWKRQSCFDYRNLISFIYQYFGRWNESLRHSIFHMLEVASICKCSKPSIISTISNWGFRCNVEYSYFEFFFIDGIAEKLKLSLK